MDFKRKIALILLGGLILGLFGSFVFAMEPAIIKDVNGQVLQLTQTQKNALSQCKTLKNISAAYGSQVLDFEGTLAPVLKDDLEQLASLIDSYKYCSAEQALRYLGPNWRCFETSVRLFKLADYLHAPENIQAVLADRIYEPVVAQIKATEDPDTKADLEVFKEIIESKLSYYPDFHALAKDKAAIQRGISDVLPLFALNAMHSDMKKLRSLNGIEVLSGSSWAKQINGFFLNNHKIAEFDLAQIRKTFPALCLLDLMNNSIRNVHLGSNENNVRIDVRNNPVQSVTIDNPRSLKNVKIVMNRNKTPKITVKQSLRDKLSAWFTALGAQSKVVLEKLYFNGMHKRNLMCAITSLAIGGITLNALRFSRLTREGYPTEYITKHLISMNKNVVKGYVLMTLAEGCFCEIVDAFFLKRFIQQDLAAYADADKHVEIDYLEPSHDGHLREVSYYKYPSKYAYNLFGKN